MSKRGIAWLLVVFACCAGALAQLPKLQVPDAFGVNIHFTDPRPGEMEMLADGGFRWVRMDFDWAAIEKKKGEYEFSAYERLLRSCDKFHIRCVLILDYANPLYDNNHSPETDEGRAAFAKWAAAAVTHFKGRGVLWEMYNEPNITPFWRPNGPNVENYIKLARAVGEAIKLAAPEELYIGPASSTLDFPFLEACFKAGLLKYWDAVSVHPYGQDPPETREEGYRKLRLLIAKYAAGKQVPILSGEWGYSTAWSGMTPQIQAKYLARQWLFNLSQEIPLSIWYDWHDDGEDPKEPEHHFGTVLHRYDPKREPVYDGKYSYTAAKALCAQLNGYRFNKRLAVGTANDFVLLFSKASDALDARIVAWTTAPAAHDVTVAASPGTFQVTSMLGDGLPAVKADEKGLTIRLNDEPQYLVPNEPNSLLRVAAKWDRAPLEMSAKRGEPLRNPVDLPPLDAAITPGWRFDFKTQARPIGAAQIAVTAFVAASEFQPVRIALQLSTPQETRSVYQEMTVVASDPLRVQLYPRLGRLLPIAVENPARTAFQGRIDVTINHGATMSDAVMIPQDLPRAVVMRAVPARERGDDVVSVNLRDDEGRLMLAAPEQRLRGMTLSAERFELKPGGDEAVQSEQSIVATSANLPDEFQMPELQAIKISYRMGAGWKYICLRPRDEQKLDGQPTALCMWLKGDGSGNRPRMRFVDSTGQTFQPDEEALDYTDWRYVRFPLSGEHAGHWGGAADGILHYPIRLETLLLIDSANRQPTKGEVLIAAPVLVFEDGGAKSLQTAPVGSGAN
jgi:hypothetical protein